MNAPGRNSCMPAESHRSKDLAMPLPLVECSKRFILHFYFAWCLTSHSWIKYAEELIISKYCSSIRSMFISRLATAFEYSCILSAVTLQDIDGSKKCMHDSLQAETRWGDWRSPGDKSLMGITTELKYIYKWNKICIQMEYMTCWSRRLTSF